MTPVEEKVEQEPSADGSGKSDQPDGAALKAAASSKPRSADAILEAEKRRADEALRLLEKHQAEKRAGRPLRAGDKARGKTRPSSVGVPSTGTSGDLMDRSKVKERLASLQAEVDAERDLDKELTRRLRELIDEARARQREGMDARDQSRISAVKAPPVTSAKPSPQPSAPSEDARQEEAAEAPLAQPSAKAQEVMLSDAALSMGGETLADSLYRQGRYRNAARLFELLAKKEEKSEERAWFRFRFANCQRHLGVQAFHNVFRLVRESVSERPLVKDSRFWGVQTLDKISQSQEEARDMFDKALAQYGRVAEDAPDTLWGRLARLEAADVKWWQEQQKRVVMLEIEDLLSRVLTNRMVMASQGDSP